MKARTIREREGGVTVLYYISYVIDMLRILAAEFDPEEGEE